MITKIARRRMDSAIGARDHDHDICDVWDPDRGSIAMAGPGLNCMRMPRHVAQSFNYDPMANLKQINFK